MTTIRRRSFAGPALAQFASTFVVCAGLVLLLPAPVSSDHDALTDDPSVCADSPDSSRDHQWTDDAGLNSPDSCDDDGEDDDDGDDDSSGGSGHAISAGERLAANFNDSFHLFHVQTDPRVFRPLDAHSLRGPPADDQKSSDACPADDDHERLRAHHQVPLPAASRRDPHFPFSVDCFRPASIGSGALRAPP